MLLHFIAAETSMDAKAGYCSNRHFMQQSIKNSEPQFPAILSDEVRLQGLEPWTP